MTALDVDSINAIFLPVRPDGKFEGDQLATLQRLGGYRKVVLLAFPPKAAGTFLRTAIIEAIDGQIVRVVQAMGGRDATPYLPTFINYYSGGITERTLVTHVHMLALPANLNFLEAFDIRPVIMKRSIPDMLASYWDMLDYEEESLKDGLNCHIPENFLLLKDTEKADFLVDILGPWYANYFAGWLRYAETNPERVCLLDYHDFCVDSVATLQKALDHVGASRPREQCEKAVATVWKIRDQFRFNQGEEGRGGHYFGAAQIDRLARLLRHYPNIAPYTDELLATGPREGTSARG